ncbi:hypothetical protein [Photorhabdus temperata]|uniref:hypothetical protein n=1 Tax=Photorhabdus temperata TaxID=574560 RepID=UPI00041C5675|nr:hypothetical protein [Photorhabdus temperata]
MQAIKIIGLFAFFFMNSMAWGNNLPQAITHYFQQIHRDNHQKVSVEIRTPERQWPQCESPEIHPSVGGQNWGNISLPIVCHQKRKFIQVAVSVTGHYWVTRRALSRNDVLSEKDLQIRSGLLEKLPNDLIVNKNEIKKQCCCTQHSSRAGNHPQHVASPMGCTGRSECGGNCTGKGFPDTQ